MNENLTDIESFIKERKQKFIDNEIANITKIADQIYGLDDVPSDFLERFKGLMTAPTAIDNKKILEAKSRRFEKFEDLENVDFSDCYLYDLMFIRVVDPTDFRPKTTGLIRYAGEDKPFVIPEGQGTK